MSNGANTDERKVALMLMAMEDLHAEAKGILAQMQAAVSEASAASREVKQAGAAVVPAVNQAASNAVTGSMKRAFADIAGPASSALDEAVKPLMEKFSRLAQLAFEMEKTAQHALRWFSYKWIALIAAAFVGIGAMAWASVWWQRNQVSELTEQKTALEADIAQMQINAEALAKKGARIKITDCGGRLCIVASKNQTGSFSDWHGLWNDKTGQTMVIPNGY
ncbi:MAG: hypothetical protein ACLPQI_00545 [Steroidobacteraceae bacterium]